MGLKEGATHGILKLWGVRFDRAMPGKAKAQNHTAKELNTKVKLANEAHGGAGGGAKGQEVRKSVKVMMQCSVCSQPNFSGIPDLKAHYDSKHPKLDFDPEPYLAQMEANKQLTKEALDKRNEKKRDIKADSKRTL